MFDCLVLDDGIAGSAADTAHVLLVSRNFDVTLITPCSRPTSKQKEDLSR